MNADRAERVRVAVRTLVDAVPVVAPPAGAIRTRAESRPGRAVRRRWVPVLAAAAVLGFVAAVAVVPGLVWRASAFDPAAGDRAVLPERIAGTSWLAASVADSPPGRAIAVVVQGSATSPPELLIVGADGRTYRQLDWPTLLGMSANRGQSVDHTLLAPDGSSLAGAGGYTIDLATAEGDWFPVFEDDSRDAWIPADVLAWSPDGRLLAFWAPADRVPASSGDGVAILDRFSGTVELVAAGGAGVPVAFSPDGNEFAVVAATALDQADAVREVRIFDVSGDLQRVLPLPADPNLVRLAIAWSPDGSLLVVAGARGPEPTAWNYTFIDATGSSGPVPEPIEFAQRDAVLLGWRSATTMLVGMDDGSGRGPNLIAEVPVDGGDVRVVSRLTPGPDGTVYDVQLATGLMADADIRDAGSPLRGPWPWQLRTGVATAAVLLLATGFLGWRWVRRRTLRSAT
jgi:hypothetical protein